jgi:hypothetical protein
MSYRQQQTNYGSKVVTGADQKVQLMSWLYSCRVKMLDAAVLEDVQRRYSKVPRQVVGIRVDLRQAAPGRGG